MPEPIIEPITIIVASTGPSPRTSPDAGRLAELSFTAASAHPVMLSEVKHLSGYFGRIAFEVI
jgi:hypothetical protein